MTSSEEGICKIRIEESVQGLDRGQIEDYIPKVSSLGKHWSSKNFAAM
jgi:hypothetical protein